MFGELARIFEAGLAPRRMKAGNTGYDAASTRRRLAGFLGSHADLNTLLGAAGVDLRGKSHKVVRENAWAGSAVDEWTSQAIGTGIRPQSRYLDPGGDRKKTRQVRRSIHELWNESGDEMDAAGVTDVYGLQALAWRTMVEAGECFLRKRLRREEDGYAVPIQYQILEPDHVPLTMNQVLPNGNTIRMGIEFNLIGQKVAFWMHPEHPQSASQFQSTGNLPRRVPADQVIHLFAPIRPGQLRGEPWLTRVLVKLYNLDQWDDATLERQKLGAMLLAWITEQTPEGMDPLMGGQRQVAGSGVDGTDTGGGETAPDGIEFGKLEPGTVLRMMLGENLNFFEPPEVGQNYAAFAEEQKRWVAQGVRSMPYEHVTGDISKSNFSSHRARTLNFRRLCEQLQFSVMVYQVCRPMFRDWLDTAVLSGALVLPGYAENPRPYRKVAHRTPRWDWLDPLSDAKAEVMLIDNLLKARSTSIQERGYDEDDVDEQIQADQEREQELALVRRAKSGIEITAAAAAGGNNR